MTLLCCFIFFTDNIHSQDTLKFTLPTAPKVKYRLSRNPASLSKALTEGRNTEKEKFDAIFTWVAGNVRYNNRLYNSGKSNQRNRSVNKVLRRRIGICTDYASLMDTLCELAGIENATVTGYSKEVIFDVNDSLYFDNHAWNAVKLKGYWYLYDVTWSSSRKTYEYTRIGKWRKKWINKLLKKARYQTVTFGIQEKNKFCGIPASKVVDTQEVMTIPFIPLTLIKVLNFFKFRVIEKMSYVSNPNYYLANPKIFALDHFPNDPIWKLSTDLANVAAFSEDSSYYYRTSLQYDTMSRLGNFCLKCGDIKFMEPMPKEKYLMKQSERNNPNNRLFPANSKFRIAQLYFDIVLEEEDSLTKMLYIDTTLMYIAESKIDLTKSKEFSRSDHRFQKAKNKAKRDEHRKENKLHLKKAKTAWRGTRKRQIKIRSLSPKAKTYDRRGKEDIRKFRKAVVSRKIPKQVSDARKASLAQKFSESNLKSDSLTRIISDLQDSLLIHTVSLWGNLLEGLNLLTPLNNSVYNDSRMRLRSSLDNYDKPVRDLRKIIMENEHTFISTVEKDIFLLGDKTYAEFILLNRIMKRRNLVNKQAAKTLKSLELAYGITKDSLKNYVQVKADIMINDACWSADNAELFKGMRDNFERFYKDSRWYFRLLNNNAYLERSRFTRITRHIDRNKKRLYHAADGNIQLNRELKKQVYLHRNEFRRKLKAERRKEK